LDIIGNELKILIALVGLIGPIQDEKK